MMKQEQPVSYEAVTTMAIDAVTNVGGCAAVSPDEARICILEEGHDGPHGWAVEHVHEWRCPHCGMTVEEYNEYLRNRAKQEQASRAAHYADDDPAYAERWGTM
ncbi:MAG: hypothetical protein LC750_07580 [Actinobacteria bacterium]|nr:hypothetical protein [Actinomycetota bacterium]